ncbi:hypothetical protein [Paenibacillus sp. WLX2291]|uniref:hypothetical protein n=1 Tax=Paenibacillus sp. WLX2291 TaxID=3296934 RepID=UPI003983E957
MNTMKKLDRQQLIALVQRIMDGEGSEGKQDEWLELLQRQVPHPEVSNLIFWDERDLTAEQIVDEALNYRAILLD